MKHNAISHLRLFAVVWPLAGLAALAGCHSNHTGQAASCEWFPGCYETPLCYGYHSTCWRPWPEECPSCPPYTLPAMPAEQVLPNPPLPGGPAPAGPMPPMPMPMPESATPPQPMLQPAAPAPAPAPPPMRGDGSAAFHTGDEPQPDTEEGQLRRRWVEGGFVSQPLNR